jgi:hypothetical protein
MPSEKEQVSSRNTDKAPPILKTGRMGGKQIRPSYRGTAAPAELRSPRRIPGWRQAEGRAGRGSKHEPDES